MASQESSDQESTELCGWRDLVLTIDDTAIAYYVDGHLFGTHDAAYLPERPMTINFNQWLIDLSSPTSLTPRTYNQQVDYVLTSRTRSSSPLRSPRR